MRSCLVFLAQIAGGISAAAVVSCLFPGPLNVETTLGGGTSISQGLFIEMFLTAQLVFVIIMLAVVKHRSTFLAPIGIGLTFFLAELCGGFDPKSMTLTRCVPLSLTVNRHLLYWRVPQLCQVPWSCSGEPSFPGLLLDLLRRSASWFCSSECLLCTIEEYAVSNLQSRPRFRRRRRST